MTSSIPSPHSESVDRVLADALNGELAHPHEIAVAINQLRSLEEQLDALRVALDRGAADYVGLLEQLEASTRTWLHESNKRVEAEMERDGLKEQLETYHEALTAIASMAGASGAGEIPAMPIAARARRALNPASGERVAAGLPSSTSETSGANQSPEDSSPASSHDAALDLAEAARLGNSSPAFVRCTDCPYDLCDQGQRCLKASSPAKERS